MTEDEHGYVKNAQRVGEGWAVEVVAKGYFYGPLDLAIGGNDEPVIVYHDHQETRFRPTLGDAALAVRAGPRWRLKTLEDGGHDGWDTRIYIDPAGMIHVSAVDPKEFDGAGVEYYRYGLDGEVSVEQIGSGPLTHKYATSVATDSAGTPYVTYYDQTTFDLILASRGASGWVRETVDADGDTGLFSDMLIDGDDRIHVSYFRRESDKSGTIKYATRAEGEPDWTFSDVAMIDTLEFGFVGARNITSLALDGEGNSWIAIPDQSRVVLAILAGGDWQLETVDEAGDLPLGQLVSLALDRAGRPHIAYFEVTQSGPLKGVVKYALGEPK